VTGQVISSYLQRIHSVECLVPYISKNENMPALIMKSRHVTMNESLNTYLFGTESTQADTRQS
jgi:hypothetical protein